jgi:hypothetical protein
MSGNIKKCELITTYTITHPDWICEWIVTSENIKRSCHLTGGLDPMDVNTKDYIEKLLPGLVNDVTSVINKWIDDGDIEAKKLLRIENKPALLTYAERILLEINKQG